MLEQLEEDQFLILMIKGSGRFVQFAAQGSYGMRIETTSNSFLSKSDRIDLPQVSALQGADWNAPTGTPLSATPDADPDGSPNFFIDFPLPLDFTEIANLTVRTLSEILRVPHPGFLQYVAFDSTREPIELPHLGLRVAPKKANPDQEKDCSAQLLAVLKQRTQIDDLEYDDDGDIGMRFGSALVFVRLIANASYVRIHATILGGVQETEDLLTRLNDINAHELLTRFFFLNGSIIAVADKCITPFIAEHVTEVLDRFVVIADGIDEVLQHDFGGKPAYLVAIPSSAKH